MPEVACCVLLCMLEVVEVVPEVMYCVLLDVLHATLYAGGGGGWALFAEDVGRVTGAGGDALCANLLAGVLDMLEVPEVMCCELPCMLEAVEGRLCLLEVSSRRRRCRR